MTKRVKKITVKIAGKTATRKTWTHTWKTFLEVFTGVLAGGIADVFAREYGTPAFRLALFALITVADVFAREYGTPAFRLALFALITVAVSTAVTAALNEDQRLSRSTKTFIQAFVGVFAGGIATVIGDWGTPAFKAGLLSLVTVGISTALAAVMNLQPSEVILGDKGAGSNDQN